MARLERWSAGVFEMALAAVVAGGACAEDLGQAVFQQNCAPCHSIIRMQNRVGPSLFGVVGRATASISSFSYSSALRASSSVWSEAALNEFVSNPQALFAGTTMRFSGLKQPADRAALIAYLKGLN